MKFTKLLIENFLAITEAKINLANRGLVLVQGENLDDTSAKSNGAGKSSIADALSWVLYGVTAREVTGDDVINEIAGKNTKVQIDIEDGDDVYRIARHRKHKTGKNSLTVLHLAKNGTIAELTKGTDKLTQEVVQQIIGASHEVFVGSIYAGQEKMPDLPAMTDKQLKVLIEEASGTTLLEEAYSEARNRVVSAKMDVQNVVTQVDKMKERLDELQNQRVTTIASRDAWKVNQVARIDAMKAEIRSLIAVVGTIDTEIAKFDESSILSDITDCNTKLAALGNEKKEYSRLSQEASRASAAYEAALRDAQNLKSRVETLERRLQQVRDKIGQPCGECGRHHTDETMEQAEKAAQFALDTEKANLVSMINAAKVAKTVSENAEKAFRAFEASMSDPSALNQTRNDHQARLDELRLLQRRRESHASKAKDVAAQAKKAAAEANPHEATIAHLETRIADGTSQIALKSKEIETLEEKVMIAESVAKVFSPAGVRAHILDEVTPYLNQQTAKYLSTLSDGNIEATWTTLVKNAKGDLREKFSIEVVNATGGKAFKGISGGEKRKVRVATALALQDLVATRATKPIELFIGDEIDDALDEAGLERLTTILEEKAKEQGSVFIISHNSLRDWISQIVTVRKEKGATTVIEETV